MTVETAQQHRSQHARPVVQLCAERQHDVEQPLDPSTYTYPAVTAAHPHAPNTAGTRIYTYDANGNATSNGTQSYVWDGENRLLSATTAGVTTSFTYAPDGSRLKKIGASGTTLYLRPTS